MARKAKEVVFFDNYDFDYYELAKEHLIELNEIENPSESQIWEKTSFLESADFETACKEIDEILSNYVLITGYCGRWGGNFARGEVFYNKSFEDILSRVLKDCEYFKFTLKSGKLEIQCSHHDGTNFYTLQNLSEKGYNLFSDWDYGQKLTNLSESEIHAKLSKSRVYTDKMAVNW